MENCSLRRQAASKKKTLIDQGDLDEQFYQLEELQDDATPNFVEDVVTSYFKESSKLLTNIDQALKSYPQDFNKLDKFMHDFKSSSSSIGASKVKNECNVFREHCNRNNLEGCLSSYEKVRTEHNALKHKLKEYFQLLRQVGPIQRATCSGS